MKRFTINRVATANIRVNRKAYISLFTGILVAVFLATATILCSWGTIRGHEEQMAERVGWMDMITLGSDEVTDEQIRRSGFFNEIGHVTVNASVESVPVCAGYYDETAERLMNRTLREGRLPEQTGEIAAEQSALIRLDLGRAAVGDTITLSMKPVYGVSEEKTFTLVGILNEQTKYLETHEEGEGMRFPALLVSPEETYGTGSALIHRVLTYAPLITFNQVERNCPVRLYRSYGISRETGEVVYYDSGWDRAANVLNRILIWVVLGAALMLSACVAITSSMESLLTRKTEDIGMLRAIGATKRQVRRIYGAEAWLLTMTALPAGMLLGVTASWLISRIAPNQVAFSPNIWLLIPILGLSALCVFVASRVPLYNASRQMPMGVLRDAALLRRAGGIRYHKTFRPDRLIAGRQTRLHPLRQLSAAGMIALTLLSALMLGELAMGMRTSDREGLADFRLDGPGYETAADSFTMTIPETSISRAELNQLNAIEGVSRFRTVTSLTANLIMDKAPEYFRPYIIHRTLKDGSTVYNTFSVLEESWRGGGKWLFGDAEDPDDKGTESIQDPEAEESAEIIQQAEAIRTRFGITEMIIPITVYVADLDAEALRKNVTDGTVDMERLDSGEQVLVYAPTLCVKQEGEIFYSETFFYPREIREAEWDRVIRNDAFTAGMTLDLLELCGKDASWIPWKQDGTGADWDAYYRETETIRAQVAVGAVLTGPVSLGEMSLFSFSVIMTPKGAEALGLKVPGPDFTDVWLSGDPNPEEEAEIEEKIGQVAVRGWLDVRNQLKLTRDYQAKKLRQILLFVSLILLFFAVSVFMQVSGTARQIRSETRTIGTLRAVGADLETLVGCYRLPVIICAAAGLIPCLLFYAVTELPGARLFTRNHPAIMIPVLVLMACCIAFACIAGIRSRLTGVTRQSIVDNIREL